MVSFPDPSKVFNAAKSTVSDAANTVKQAPGAALNVGKEVVDKAGDVAEVAKQAPGVIKETVEDTVRIGKYIADHPPDLGQIKRTSLALGKAIITGERQVVKGDIAPYDQLDPTEKQAAYQRGEGQSVEQPYIAGDQAGTNKNEPINLVVTGDRKALESALKQAGWYKAPQRNLSEYAEMGGKVILGVNQDTNGPVSAAYVDGKSEVVAFNKNDDYNAARDHMRIYPMGKDPATGEDRWGLAGTRDTALTLSRPELAMDGLLPKITKAPGFGHEIDKEIDRERDMIMHNLLGTGVVEDWAAVDGKRSGAPEKQLEDGRFELPDEIKTDGKVYTVRLKPSEE